LSMTLSDGRVVVWQLTVDASQNGTDISTDYSATDSATYIASYLQVFNSGNNKVLGGGNPTGNGGYDVLVAGTGGNNMNGRAGADTLIGGAGNDTINGGAGN